MQEIIDEFIVETVENLDRLDSLFVSLESDPHNVDILANIFRDVHTIKGTSGFLGFNKLERVAHVGENLLSKLRDGELVLTANRTTVLLHMVDAIREIITSIEQTQGEGNGNYERLVEELTRAVTDDEAAPSKAPATPSAPTPAPVTPPAESSTEPAPVDTDNTASALQSTSPDGTDVAPDGTADSSSDAGTTLDAAGRKPLDQQAIDPSLFMMTPPVSEKVEEPAPQQEQKISRSAADSSIRVDVDLLDDLMNLVGELVLARNQILQYQLDTQDASLQDTSQRLNLITTELQEGVMKTRMQPIGNVFSKFPRVVRDIARDLGKQVDIVMEGRETELDKTIIEAIKDPLTHMVRNSVDHGIEHPEIRSFLGKPISGTLKLRAFHEGGQVNIEIEDDGAGIDPQRIKRIAIEKNVLSASEAQLRSDRELINLIFHPGFSTAEKVTNVSGRGVGMDVVRTSIESIGGSIEVISELNKGSTMRIKIPLTLAIIPALMVESQGERYAIPQVSLVELVRLEEASKDIEMINGTPVYRLRGRLLPLVYLDELLGTSSDAPQQSGNEDGSVNIVVLQAENTNFGLVVETVNDTAEIVVKPLGEVLKEIPVYAGAMVMGDGVVALILDVLGVAQQAGINSKSDALGEVEEPTSTDKEAEPLLLFRLGDDPHALMGRMAVPLRQVARLEEIDASRIEYASGKPVVQYRGHILPLVWLGETLGLGANRQLETVQVIVYERDDNQIGFIVDAISDVVNEVLDIERPSDILGVRGSAVINGIVTDVLDVDAVIAVEAPDLLQSSASA
ncbi:chemotaxis protein CheW [Stomatohabitans albus]|uniref:chemotaxis protein CheW n=1 Tax=Stomatohabitans albus TaxID=3110766 RepID=UPI00300CA042